MASFYFCWHVSHSNHSSSARLLSHFFGRMQAFLMPVQAIFRLKFALALVTSEPSHGLRGSVFAQHVMFQIVLSFRPVLAVDAVEPFRFFVGFVPIYVRFQVVFP
jgi:hypothetical protein